MDRCLSVFILSCVVGAGLLGLRPTRAPTDAHSPGPGVSALSASEVERLDREVIGLLGHGASPERLARLEDEMRPMYATLPKSGGNGTVSPAAASYALHRYFAVTRAWRFKKVAHLKRSEVEAEPPASLLKSTVPDAISEVLEAYMGSKLIGLEDLAVLAATLEDVVYGETVDLLLQAYKINGLSIAEPLNREQQTSVVQAYSYIMGILTSDSRSIDNATRQDVASALTNPLLQDVILWASDTLETIKFQDRTTRKPFARSDDALCSFAVMAQWSEKVLSGLGWAQKADCDSLKRELLEIESPSAPEGKVDFTAFYTGHLKSLGMKFSQVQPYLQYLGALGTSRQNGSHAIVANYLYASPMCLDTPTMLTLCCFNECNVLMDALERRVARAAASPRMIASSVVELPSSSVAAPRNLSGTLLRGLDNIADRHGGLVPLHSKAFALWMHRAYPAECPHPAVPGAEHAPWVGDAFVQSVESTTSFMSAKVERWHAYDGGASGDAETAEAAEHDFEEEGEAEEVLVPQKPAGRGARGTNLQVALRFLALVGFVVASGLGLLAHWRGLASAVPALNKPSDQLGVFL